MLSRDPTPSGVADPLAPATAAPAGEPSFVVGGSASGMVVLGVSTGKALELFLAMGVAAVAAERAASVFEVAAPGADPVLVVARGVRVCVWCVRYCFEHHGLRTRG